MTAQIQCFIHWSPALVGVFSIESRVETRITEVSATPCLFFLAPTMYYGHVVMPQNDWTPKMNLSIPLIPDMNNDLWMNIESNRSIVDE